MFSSLYSRGLYSGFYGIEYIKVKIVRENQRNKWKLCNNNLCTQYLMFIIEEATSLNQGFT